MENGFGSLMSDSASSSIRRARMWGGTGGATNAAFLRLVRRHRSHPANASSTMAAIQKTHSQTLAIWISGLTVSLNTSGTALEAAGDCAGIMSAEFVFILIRDADAFRASQKTGPKWRRKARRCAPRWRRYW